MYLEQRRRGDTRPRVSGPAPGPRDLGNLDLLIRAVCETHECIGRIIPHSCCYNAAIVFAEFRECHGFSEPFIPIAPKFFGRDAISDRLHCPNESSRGLPSRKGVHSFFQFFISWLAPALFIDASSAFRARSLACRNRRFLCRRSTGRCSLIFSIAVISASLKRRLMDNSIALRLMEVVT